MWESNIGPLLFEAGLLPNHHYNLDLFVGRLLGESFTQKWASHGKLSYGWAAFD